MKRESDGFVTFEYTDDFFECVKAINQNTLLLREQIKKIQQELEVQRISTQIKAGD